MKKLNNVVKMKADHPDKLILLYAAQWKAARAQLNLIWANSDKATLFGACVPADGYMRNHPDREALELAFDELKEAENSLEDCKPTTTLAAHVLLEAAIDMLRVQERDPEAALGQGPAMKFLMNIAKALAYRDIKIRDKDEEDAAEGVTI